MSDGFDDRVPPPGTPPETPRETPRETVVTEGELHAWLDGELSPERREAVETHLAAHPEDRRRFETYREQADAVRRTFGTMEFAAPLPIHVASRPLRGTSSVGWRVAAAVALFVAGLAVGWSMAGGSIGGGSGNGETVAAARPVGEDAMDAHRVFVAEVRHPVEVAARDEAHLVAWLSHRLGAPLRVPNLTAQGFSLMGGRLLPSSAGPAAQFMYQDAGGRRVTLYVRRTGDGGQTAFRLAEDGPVSALYWRDRGLSWAVVGEIGGPSLDALAHRVYETFNF